MYTITKTNDKTAYNLYKFICNTEMELQDVPIDCSPGSQVLIIETGNIYILNNKHEWIALLSGKMSDFSLPKWKGGNY